MHYVNVVVLWAYVGCVPVCRYAQVLRENPGCPVEVRLGLAACLYRGGKLERASTAYKRCVR